MLTLWALPSPAVKMGGIAGSTVLTQPKAPTIMVILGYQAVRKLITQKLKDLCIPED